MINYERRPSPQDYGRYDCICGHTQMYHEGFFFFFVMLFRHHIFSSCEICMCPKFRSKETYTDDGSKKKGAN